MKSYVVIQALMSMGFLPLWAYQVVDSAERHGLEPVQVAGIILSEHRGVLGDKATKVANSSTGCVGLGQIAPWWVRNARFKELGSWDIKRSDLRTPIHNIEATARVLRISKEGHDRAHGRRSSHHWIAHYKCGWSSHDRCGLPTRNALRYMDAVQSKINEKALELGLAEFAAVR